MTSIKTRLSIPFAVMLFLLTGLGLFLLLFGSWGWAIIATSGNAKEAPMLFWGLLFPCVGGLCLWAVWLRLTTLEIDSLTGAVTVRSPLGKQCRWDRAQIQGYSTGSVWAKLVTTEALYLHISGREPLMLVALGTRNFPELKALAMATYPAFDLNVNHQQRKPSRSTEIRRLLTKAPKGK